MPVSFEVGVIVLAAPLHSKSSITSVSMSIVSSEKAVCAFDSPYLGSFILFIAKYFFEGKGLDAHWLLLLSFKAAFEAVLPVV
jgi:uncharacterized membrane protein